MANLTAKTAFDGLLPITAGTVTLSEVTPEAITWIAPGKGKGTVVSKALNKLIGADFPAPNRVTGGSAKVIWSGPGQALVVGPVLAPVTGAAMSDQTGAWAMCAIEGADAHAVLARLVPIDLRPDTFEVGHGARTMMGHMNCVLTRTGIDRFEVMVFRSMATTAVHEVERAMRMITARAAIA